MSTTNVLVTGANRGIGKGLLAAYLSRPDTVAIAGVRNPTDANSKSLSSLPVGKGSKLIIVKIESDSETDAQVAADALKSKHSITHLDVVIANAGISKFYGPATKTPLTEVWDHFRINTVGPLVLFQAMWPLLKEAKQPKFIVISTAVASMAILEHIPLEATAYGSSKAAVNYITLKIHHENPSLIAFPLNPGWVQTDMGNMGAAAAGIPEAPVKLHESVEGILDKIDNATRETHSGKFISFDGETLGW